MKHCELVELLAIQDMHLAPIDEVADSVHLQHDPATVATKVRLENVLLADLESVDVPCAGSALAPITDAIGDGVWSGVTGDEVADALRRLAAVSSMPPIYDWLADSASPEEIWWFLAVEGGPDGGFDDLVALAQVGLAGEAKLEMARNYWDEMGRGSPGAVHTELHRDLTVAGDMPPLERHELPGPALMRMALASTLATNRSLQPELVGALGLTELQAGPRSRRVATALRRINAPTAVLPFYDEHADTDPRHGKDWLANVVVPLVEDATDDSRARWAGGMVRGAWWRATANTRFLADASERLKVAS